MKIWDCKIALTDDRTIWYTALNEQKYKAQVKLDELTKSLLARFNYWIGEEKLNEREDLEMLGRFLYSVLLPTGEGADPKDPEANLRKVFEADYAFFLKKKGKADERLRLTLEIHKEAGELSRFPWEFLFKPEGKSGFFLAGEKTELILTRFVPKVPPEINVKTGEPLRILVVFSHPKALQSIDSGITRDLIRDIQELEKLKRIEVRVEENPTHEHLCKLMNGDEPKGDAAKKPPDRLRFKPDIIHFIGHGEPGRLALVRDAQAIQNDVDAGKGDDDQDWCDSQAVLDLFQTHTPRMVFLHACDGAKPKSIEGFSDLARDLVYAKVPVVVAMQYTIKNKDAAIFAKRFYEEIRKGRPIDEAVRAGREMLGQRQDKRAGWSDRRFGTPVVYLQTSSEEAMIKIDESEEESRDQEDGWPAGHDPNQKVACPNPKCEGRIPLNSIVCVLCDHEVMLCPECKKKEEFRLISKNLGRCGICGYRMPERERMRATPATAEEAVQPEKTASQPAAALPRVQAAESASASAAPAHAPGDTDRIQRASNQGTG